MKKRPSITPPESSADSGSAARGDSREPEDRLQRRKAAKEDRGR
jgi:hypothetical protein